MMKTFLQTLAVVLVVAGLGFFSGRCTTAVRPSVEIRTDTIVITDTIRDTVLVPVSRYIVRVDTAWLPVVPGEDIASRISFDRPPTTTDADTVKMVDVLWDADSVRVMVPIEQRVYQTDDYRAVVEGFRPALLSIEIYRRTQIVTPAPTTDRSTPHRWGFGIQAGYGITPRGPQPYIGVGVQYSILRW